ncbi:STAS domain-containing protein [Nocardia brasiliensis]|uniref:STAS domain-containing protein n=1 Tax=Nocardia brasiliensis TaxID=37326 RepID=A0A6G9XUE7_NOCBR|nr:STAS domain-containing protein [Nocardia brasiliensis]QIS04453.1 STAS domain-containing protein [Nocardia brasiliensis]
MSANSALHEYAEGVHRNGSAPRHRRTDSRACVQRVDRRHEGMVVRVEGEVDAIACPQFAAAVERAIRADRRTVVIDLRAARFLSIRAAATLATARQRAACDGVDIRLVGAGREVERSLEVSGVRSLFSAYPSVRAALDG